MCMTLTEALAGIYGMFAHASAPKGSRPGMNGLIYPKLSDGSRREEGSIRTIESVYYLWELCKRGQDGP